MAIVLSDRFGVAAPFLTAGPKQHYIDGSWVSASDGAVMGSIDPSTGQKIVDFAAGTREDIDRAVAAARRAFVGSWSKVTPMERQNVLLRLADLCEEHALELKRLDVLDMGSPIGRGSKSFTPQQVLRFFAGAATRLDGHTLDPSVSPDVWAYTRKEPVGVVGAIIPWNGPVINAIMKIAPVLATGCTMVLKPAEEACLSNIRLMELIEQLDLPDGVVNMVTGVGEVVGAALVEHPDVDKVAFTGSTEVGQSLVRAAAGNLKRLSLELGGKSADVVFADADLAKAIPGAGMAVFANTGQICAAGTRVYVERPIYDEFIAGLADYAKNLKVGDGLDPETVIGPVVSLRQLDRVCGYIDAGRDQGAVTVAGGQRITDRGLAEGYFLEPTVFSEVEDDMSIAVEEIFGPVASVMPFDEYDDMIIRANRTQYGLGGGVWTTDLSKAHKTAHALRTGAVWINGYGYFDAAVPFGGYKMSGWGRELSAESVEEYLQTKAVWMTL